MAKCLNLLLAILLQVAAQLSGTPAWTTNPNLNAGQAVAINSQSPSDWLASNSSVSKFQNYQFTGFTSIPRVIVAMIGYGQFQPSSPTQQLGFSFNITNINLTSFDYTVTSYDLTTYLLHYNYLAVQNELTTYFLELVDITFNASSNLVDPNATNRYAQYIMANPQNQVNSNYLTQNIQIMAFPVAFQLQTPSLNSYFSINSTVLNSTHYSLNVSTAFDNILTKITYSVISFNKDFITNNNQAFVDIILGAYIGFTAYNYGDNITAETYMYRNGVSGAVHVEFPLNGSQTQPNYFYYNFSSSPASLAVFRGFNHRIPSCTGNLSLYEPSTVLCHDACPSGTFLDSGSQCTACHYSCQNCSSNSSSSCISCPTSSFRVSNTTNNSCPCMTGYFDNNTAICNQCSSECLTCSSFSVCQSCNSSENRILSANSCICDNQSYLNGTCLTCSSFEAGCLQCSFSSNTFTCLSGPNSTNTCGNGLIESGEQCDDNNAADFDGCSSSCLVQTDHTCFVNSSLSAYSVCYYSKQIGLTTKQIYKVPGQNSVQIVIEVNAPNCNQDTLKKYLEQTQSIKLYDNARRLYSIMGRQLQSWISIPVKTVAYDAQNSQMKVSFSYNANIDLSQKYFQLDPSTSTTNAHLRYFYSTPVVQLGLTSPYNNLSTNFYSQSQLSSVSALITMFKVLVALYLVFLIVAVVFKRGAVAAECLLVFQMCYLMLLGQRPLIEGFSALQQSGKYTFGYNVAFLNKYYLSDLMALDLDSNAMNSLSITSLLLFLLFLITAILLVVNHYKRKKQHEALALATEISYDSQRVNEQNKEKPVKQTQKETTSKLEKVISYLLDILLTIFFITISVVVILLCFTHTSVYPPNLALGFIYLALAIVFWYLYFRKKSQWFFSVISFTTILRQKHSCEYSKIMTQFYYICMFICLLLNGIILTFTRTTSAAAYSIILVACLTWIILIGKFDIYFYNLDKIRAILNLIAIIISTIFALVGSYAYNSLSTGAFLAYILFTILLLILIGNAIIFGVVAYQTLQKRSQFATKVQQTHLKELLNKLALSNIPNTQQNNNKIALIEESSFASHTSTKKTNKNQQVVVQKLIELKTLKKNMFKEVKINQLHSLDDQNLQNHQLELQDKMEKVQQQKSGLFDQSFTARKALDEPNHDITIIRNNVVQQFQEHPQSLIQEEEDEPLSSPEPEARNSPEVDNIMLPEPQPQNI